jgi:hypothetical protein
VGDTVADIVRAMKLLARFREEGALDMARRVGAVCTDEYLLHPDPYPSRETRCRARVAYTRSRLDEVDPALSTVLVNHFPLVREPTRVLHHPAFAQWCGCEAAVERLAWALPSRRGGLRPPAHSAHHPPRRGAAPRGLARLTRGNGRGRPAKPPGLCRILPGPVMALARQM